MQTHWLALSVLVALSASTVEAQATPTAPQRAISSTHPNATSATPQTAAQALAAPRNVTEGRHPIFASERPLTLTQGTLRTDSSALVHASTSGAVLLTVGLAVGLLDEVEISVLQPVPSDTIFGVTARWFRSPEVELGVRGTVVVPFTSNTLVYGNSAVYTRLGVPVVLHPTRELRIQTGVDLDILHTPNIEPTLSFPLQLLYQIERAFVGVQGAYAYDFRGASRVDASVFVGGTIATRTQPIMDIRLIGGTILARAPIGYFASLNFSFFVDLY